MNRPNKVIYYLEVARAISLRSTCMRNHCGVIIVKDDSIVSTGYNGAPRGRKNCIDIGDCYRMKHNIPSGSNYECCRASHGEWNAMISASRNDMLNGTMYIFQWDPINHRVRENPGCCQICQRMIINAGIEEVIFADPDGIGATPTQYGYRVQKVRDWVLHESDALIG